MTTHFVASAQGVTMKRVVVASVLALIGSYFTSARAQEAGRGNFFEKAMPSPTQSFELAVSSAYNQGWGNITDTNSLLGRTFGRQVQDVAGAGLQFELDLGYRISPRFATGIYGTIAGYTNPTPLEGANFRTLTGGIQGQWYMRPFHAFNPWVTLGSAYRGSWFVPEVGGITSRHGWELARLQIGTDFRVSREFAISPFVGGDLNLVFAERVPNGSFRNLDGPPAYATFTAGVLGRYDTAPTYVTSSGATARR
jgi:hypothetical protein